MPQPNEDVPFNNLNVQNTYFDTNKSQTLIKARSKSGLSSQSDLTNTMALKIERELSCLKKALQMVQRQEKRIIQELESTSSREIENQTTNRYKRDKSRLGSNISGNLQPMNDLATLILHTESQDHLLKPQNLSPAFPSESSFCRMGSICKSPSAQLDTEYSMCEYSPLEIQPSIGLFENVNVGISAQNSTKNSTLTKTNQMFITAIRESYVDRDESSSSVLKSKQNYFNQQQLKKKANLRASQSNTSLQSNSGKEVINQQKKIVQQDLNRSNNTKAKVSKENNNNMGSSFQSAKYQTIGTQSKSKRRVTEYKHRQSLDSSKLIPSQKSTSRDLHQSTVSQVDVSASISYKQLNLKPSQRQIPVVDTSKNTSKAAAQAKRQQIQDQLNSIIAKTKQQTNKTVLKDNRFQYKQPSSQERKAGKPALNNQIMCEYLDDTDAESSKRYSMQVPKKSENALKITITDKYEPPLLNKQRTSQRNLQQVVDPQFTNSFKERRKTLTTAYLQSKLHEIKPRLQPIASAQISPTNRANAITPCNVMQYSASIQAFKNIETPHKLVQVQSIATSPQQMEVIPAALSLSAFLGKQGPNTFISPTKFTQDGEDQSNNPLAQTVSSNQTVIIRAREDLQFTGGKLTRFESGLKQPTQFRLTSNEKKILDKEEEEPLKAVEVSGNMAEVTFQKKQGGEWQRERRKSVGCQNCKMLTSKGLSVKLCPQQHGPIKPILTRVQDKGKQQQMKCL